MRGYSLSAYLYCIRLQIRIKFDFNFETSYQTYVTDKLNRYYIKIRAILGINPKTIFEKLEEALGPDAPSYSIIQDWAQRFRKGR